MKKFFIFLISILVLGMGIAGLVFLLGTNKILGGVLLGASVILCLFVVINYNKLVNYKHKVKESLALIDIQLKLRFDLVPNLVNTVKGYAKHEKEVLTEVIKARTMAVEAKTEEEKLEYANKLVPQMRNLIAVAESYPELKADALYKSLMGQLVEIEDRLVSARRIYDSNVNIYNTTIETFPQNIIASMFAFKTEPLFKIDAGENIVPKI